MTIITRLHSELGFYAIQSFIRSKLKWFWRSTLQQLWLSWVEGKLIQTWKMIGYFLSYTLKYFELMSSGLIVT